MHNPFRPPVHPLDMPPALAPLQPGYRVPTVPDYREYPKPEPKQAWYYQPEPLFPPKKKEWWEI